MKVLILSNRLHDQHAEAATAVQRWGGKTGVMRDAIDFPVGSRPSGTKELHYNFCVSCCEFHWSCYVLHSSFSALTLLVWWQDGHPACKKTEWWDAGMVICREQCADLHMAQRMPLPVTVSCFSKIEIGLPFWYRLTRVVLDKGPLNGCVCMCYTTKKTRGIAICVSMSELQHTHTHTHTHTFNGPLFGTTRLSRYQKGKTYLDFTEARDIEWQWHQLGHMQVCTSLQITTPAPHHSEFLQVGGVAQW